MAHMFFTLWLSAYVARARRLWSMASFVCYFISWNWSACVLRRIFCSPFDLFYHVFCFKLSLTVSTLFPSLSRSLSYSISPSRYSFEIFTLNGRCTAFIGDVFDIFFFFVDFHFWSTTCCPLWYWHVASRSNSLTLVNVFFSVIMYWNQRTLLPWRTLIYDFV